MFKDIFASLSPAVKASTGLGLLVFCLILCVAIAVSGLEYLSDASGFGADYIKAILILTGISGFTVIGLLILNGGSATLGPSVNHYPKGVPIITDSRGPRLLEIDGNVSRTESSTRKSRLPDPVIKVSGNGSGLKLPDRK